MTGKALAIRLLKTVSVFAVLALAIELLRFVEPNSEFFSRFVDAHIRAHGATGVLLYVGLVAAMSCLGVPRQLLAFAGGYAFGAAFGTFWATLGTTLGCALAFGYARCIGQRFVQQKFGRYIDKLESFLTRSPFAMAFVIRAMPVGHNLSTNVLAGVTRISALPFFLGSCLGYIPQNFIFALLGSGIHVDSFWTTAVSAALFVVSSLVGLWLYRRYRQDVDAMTWTP